MAILVCNYRILKSLMLGSYDPKLVALAIWCATRWSEFHITSASREGDKGVHGTVPCRGLDARSRNFSAPEAMAEDANRHWVYDPQRPKFKCVLYHKTPNGAWHLHLQVHPKTKYLGD